MKKTLSVTLIVVAGLFLLSAPTVLAQGEPCTADFNCDQNVDGYDVGVFISQFGRSQYSDPCPDCYDSPCPCSLCLYGMVDCGDKCVDPMTDEDYCGVDSECVGGTVCAAGEICVDGTCTLSCPSGQTNCAGACVDPMTDETYCGADVECTGGTLCGVGEVCVGGVCVLNCPPGLTDCSGTCVDTDTDESNCGFCDIPCESGAFCVAGNCEVYSIENYAPVAKTGQYTSYEDYDDAYYEQGVGWPDPRFTDNGDGTATDNLTGLIWLLDNCCFGYINWVTALSFCNGLADGQCGLTDGSQAADWRLPNIRELQSLIDFGLTLPALPYRHPFGPLPSVSYWTSTTATHSIDNAWYMDLDRGGTGSVSKSYSFCVWPVRGGH